MKRLNLFRLGIFIFVGLFIVALVGCGEEVTKDIDQSKEEGKVEKMIKVKPEELADVFLSGDYERIYKQTSKEFQKQVSLKQLQEIGKDFNQDVTSYTMQSKLPLDPDVEQYTWKSVDDKKGMLANFDKRDTIIGFRVLSLKTYPKTDALFTKTIFKLPFENEWFVVWGGTNSLVNYHYEYESQRYAYDFVIMKDNQTYNGDPTKNESYYAFGKNMFVPADGKIVEVENGIKDNKLVGEMNEKQPAGNYVVIDHGNDEYSLLAHFKYGSIIVKPGDQVKEGELLGLVGNSGNSSEAHIHFQVANGSDLDASKSIRIRFNLDEELLQGDFIKR